jgi:DNA processing protein
VSNDHHLVNDLTLLSAPGLGPAGHRALLSHFGSSDRILAASFDALCAVEGIGLETARSIRAQTDRKWATEQLAACENRGVRLLGLNDPAYPNLLRHTYAPPPVLFLLGDADLLNQPTVAIVGSRANSPYGKEVARQLATRLVRAGVVVVSGLALGIDGHAHRGALEADGGTIAVLGSGLDRPTPPSHLELFRAVAQKGVVVSEFPIGKSADPGHFPRRNRVISGLSLGVIVVEAGRKSGSLITARLAVEQDRDVFAVPGPITASQSEGPHALIRDGATLIRNADDVLEQLGLPISTSSNRHANGRTLVPEELSIVDHLSRTDPIHVDQLAHLAGLALPQLSALLLGLELESRITQHPGQRYTLAA